MPHDDGNQVGRWIGHIQCLSKVWLSLPKKPLLTLSLPAELDESFLEEEIAPVAVQFPAPPRPTCQIAPSLSFRSRELWRSNSSSKEKIAFSEFRWMFPAPPRPLLNFSLVWGRPCSNSEAGPVAVRPLLVLGALMVLPAPPRPVWAYLRTVGWGSVTEYLEVMVDNLRWEILVLGGDMIERYVFIYLIS